MLAWQSAYVFVLSLLMMALIGIGGFARWRRLLAGNQALIGILLCTGVISSYYILELLTTNQDIRIALEKAQFAGTFFLPVVWLVFAARNSAHPHWQRLRGHQAFVVLPLLMLALAFTNNWHGLVWSLDEVTRSGQGVKLTFGLASIVYILLSSVGQALGSFILVQRAFRVADRSFVQRGALATGALLGSSALILNIVSMGRIGDFDLSPLLFIVSCLLIIWALIHSPALAIINAAYRATNSRIQSGVLVLDARNRIVDINPTAASIFNISKTQLYGQSATQLFDDAAASTLLGNASESQISIKSPHNQAIHYDLRMVPLYSQRGAIIGRLLSIHDQTAQWRAEAQQRLLSEAILLLTAQPQDDQVLQKLGRLIVPALANWSLLAIDEHGEQPARVMLTLADATKQVIVDKLAEQGLLERCSPRQAVLLLKTNSPETFSDLPEELWVALSADEADPTSASSHNGKKLIAQKLMSQGSRIGVLLLGTADQPFSAIEEQIAATLASRIALALETARLLAQMRAAQEAAQHTAQTKSDFLANLSHEVRTAMNAAVSATDLLLRTSLATEQLGLVEIMRRSGEMLLDIVNTTLDYSKIESGKVEFHNVRFNLRNCIEDMLQIIAPKASQKALDLCYTISPDVPIWLVADIARLRQIMANLLSNSVKFTEKGEIVVSVTSQPLSAKRVEVQIAVSDTGIGIPADAIERLFQPFSQISHGRKHATGGTGLGLAISKSLCELMGGTISVVSTPGQGSTFTFSFVAVPSPHQPVDPLAGMQATLAGKRAMIVGKRTTSLHLLKLQLQEWGMRVQHIDGHAEAQARMRRVEGFDIALIALSFTTNDDLLRAVLQTYRSLNQRPIIRLAWFGEPEPADSAILPLIYSTLYQPIVRHLLHASLVSALDQTTSSVAIQHKAVVPENRSRLRVLVADDNLTNQTLAMGCLILLNHEVEVVADGQSALAALARSDYEVVLLDLQMPELNGIEVVQAIRRDLPQARQPYVIAMTASALDGDRERCIAAGMNDYLSKPMRIEELSQALERYFDRGQAGVYVIEDFNQVVQEAEDDDDRLSEPVEQPYAVEISRAGASVNPVDLQSLDTMLGAKLPAFMALIVEHYIQDGEQLLHELELAASEANSEQIRAIAHQLKSSSAIVGAAQLARYCSDLEQQAHAGPPMHWPTSVATIRSEFERVKHYFASLSPQTTLARPPLTNLPAVNGL